MLPQWILFNNNSLCLFNLTYLQRICPFISAKNRLRFNCFCFINCLCNTNKSLYFSSGLVLPGSTISWLPLFQLQITLLFLLLGLVRLEKITFFIVFILVFKLFFLLCIPDTCEIFLITTLKIFCIGKKYF